jgi:hypothetical protein
MFRNIDNEHLNDEQLRRLNQDKEGTVALNDHLKICEYCAEKSREMAKLILQEKIKSTTLFSAQSSEIANN